MAVEEARNMFLSENNEKIASFSLKTGKSKAP